MESPQGAARAEQARDMMAAFWRGINPEIVIEPVPEAADQAPLPTTAETATDETV